MRRRILFVEDNEDTLILVSLLLDQANIGFATARTFRDALQKAKTESFDLILLDNRLPDGDGVDLCRSIREFNTTTPIIFYTAAAYPADKARGLMAGAQRYLVKPTDIQNLEKTILEFLHKDSGKSEGGHG